MIGGEDKFFEIDVDLLHGKPLIVTYNSEEKLRTYLSKRCGMSIISIKEI